MLFIRVSLMSRPLDISKSNSVKKCKIKLLKRVRNLLEANEYAMLSIATDLCLTSRKAIPINGEDGKCGKRVIKAVKICSGRVFQKQKKRNQCQEEKNNLNHSTPYNSMTKN
uniref:Uncharacterized protein n=1 Tax=Glossina pallidipes TaxID=7398 RepID=A0A1A9Z6Q6_GLOPL